MSAKMRDGQLLFRLMGQCGAFPLARARFASMLLVALLFLQYLTGCGSCPSSVKCHDFEGKIFYPCCGDMTPQDPNRCCNQNQGTYQGDLSQLPKPDLSYASLDGEVDFGTTTLKVEIRDGDSFETKLKGRVALTGVCSPSDSNCQLQLILAELRPVQDPLPIITTKQRTVSGLFVRNVNTWTGTRTMNGTSNDGLINIDATSKLALEANIDGKNQGVVLNANAYRFKAHLYYLSLIHISEPTRPY